MIGDEGYLWCLGPCWACGQVFAFDPERVPSIRVEGEREPVCESCMARANAQRAERGLPPHAVMPGAYIDRP